jgi:hypothetical protein
MNVNTLIEIVRKLPGVYVDSWDIERTYGERTKLGLVITCDEQPTPYEIVVRVEPGDPPIRPSCANYVDDGSSEYCDSCQAERRAGLR